MVRSADTVEYAACAQGAAARTGPSRPVRGPDRAASVTFAFDSAEITGASMATLDVAAETLRECPKVRAEVGGYTDSIGTDAYNQALSLRRAESVRSYLIKQAVSPGRLEAKGYGESNPVASNDTEDGRAQNRRVELKPSD
jgi:OOP family OmpA-OmpF porin